MGLCSRYRLLACSYSCCVEVEAAVEDVIHMIRIDKLNIGISRQRGHVGIESRVAYLKTKITGAIVEGGELTVETAVLGGSEYVLATVRIPNEGAVARMLLSDEAVAHRGWGIEERRR